MRMVELGEVAAIDRESIIPSEIRTGTKYLGLENVYSDGTALPVDVEQGELLSNKFVFGPNHLLYGKLRPYLSKITLPDFEGICSTDIIPILPDANKLEKRYLYYYLRTPWMIETAVKACSGANLPRVDPKLLAQFKIPLPPLPEQRRIAAILDKAQALVANDKRTLAVYDQLAKSLFLEMFGDGNPDVREWPLVELKDLVSSAPNSLRSGPFGSDLLHSEFVDEGVAVLGIDNAVENRFSWKGRRFITHEKYNELKRYTVRPGDVLITIMATIGRSAVVPADIGPAINSKHLAAITLDQSKANPAFISFSIHSDERVIHQLFARSRGAIMSGLNLSLIKEVKLRLPPIDVQEHFCQALSRIERDKALATESLHQSEALFGSLLQGAFSGSLGR
ncbi:MAG: restriction endonuclease subunit S [Flavobacteriales bacterium]|nr:MAG: restriction endonuclease subunit S [Flavobacteriales bacterium]